MSSGREPAAIAAERAAELIRHYWHGSSRSLTLEIAVSATRSGPTRRPFRFLRRLALLTTFPDIVSQRSIQSMAASLTRSLNALDDESIQILPTYSITELYECLAACSDQTSEILHTPLALSIVRVLRHSPHSRVTRVLNRLADDRWASLPHERQLWIAARDCRDAILVRIHEEERSNRLLRPAPTGTGDLLRPAGSDLGNAENLLRPAPDSPEGTAD